MKNRLFNKNTSHVINHKSCFIWNEITHKTVSQNVSFYITICLFDNLVITKCCTFPFVYGKISTFWNSTFRNHHIIHTTLPNYKWYWYLLKWCAQFITLISQLDSLLSCEAMYVDWVLLLGLGRRHPVTARRVLFRLLSTTGVCLLLHHTLGEQYSAEMYTGSPSSGHTAQWWHKGAPGNAISFWRSFQKSWALILLLSTSVANRLLH